MRSIIVFALLFLLLAPGGTAAQDPDARSRCLPTGPPPAGGYSSYRESLLKAEESVIPGVPAYLWRHGCGPTAAGMVIGYWDGHGCPDLVPGDAGTQTSAVEQAIASDDDPASHYYDYSLPIDYVSTGLRPDLSESPVGDEHPSDCLADFMMTSWSSMGNYYGWSWFFDVGAGMVGYCEYINSLHPGAGYRITVQQDAISWASYVAEIDAGRPVVLLVDTDGDGGTDHFVTAVGWREDKGVREYACFDTWAPVDALRWCPFRFISPATTWGIYGGIFCEISPAASPVPGETDVLCARLLPSCPNPFNPRTRVYFTLDRPQQVRLEVFDLAGQLVTVLADRIYGAGSHSVDWQGRDRSGRDMPTGTYLVRLQTLRGVDTQKIALVR